MLNSVVLRKDEEANGWEIEKIIYQICVGGGTHLTKIVDFRKRPLIKERFFNFRPCDCVEPRQNHAGFPHNVEGYLEKLIKGEFAYQGPRPEDQVFTNEFQES